METVSEGSAGSSDRSRLDQVLDVVGLLLLGWMVALWWLGSLGVPPWLGEYSGAQSPRTMLTVALVVLALPLMVAVLVSFGQLPTRIRQLAAVPLLATLAAVAVWRIQSGLVSGLANGQTESMVKGAGFWDGAALEVGLAATALLAIRAYRLTRGLLLIATAAVVTAVTASLITWLLPLSRLFHDTGDSEAFTFGWAFALPPLLMALLWASLAPFWLRGLWQGDLRAAAALVLWGFVVGAAAVLPRDFSYLLTDDRYMAAMLSSLGAPVDGLDWARGALAVAAAVLIAPVVRAYPTLGRRVRASILSGPLLMLALLLICRLGAQLIGYRLLATHQERPGLFVVTNYPQVVYGAEQVIAVLVLIGAGLILLAAARPRDRFGVLAVLGAVVLIVAPVGLYLVPGVLRRGDRYSQLAGSEVALIQPLAWWSGDSFALIVVLPVLLLALLIANRARPVPPSPSPEAPASGHVR